MYISIPVDEIFCSILSNQLLSYPSRFKTFVLSIILRLYLLINVLYLLFWEKINLSIKFLLKFGEAINNLSVSGKKTKKENNEYKWSRAAFDESLFKYIFFTELLLLISELIFISYLPFVSSKLAKLTKLSSLDFIKLIIWSFLIPLPLLKRDIASRIFVFPEPFLP